MGIDLVKDIAHISPAIALFLASLVPLTHKVLRGNREPHSLITMSYVFIGVISSLGFLFAGQSLRGEAFSGALVFDGLSFLGALIAVLIAGVAAVFSRENVATNNRNFSEYVFLLLNSTAGMMLVAWANDFMTMFIGIELMSLCLYVLIALSSEDRLSKESAFKYFLMGSFASAILLYGIAFIFGTVGVVSFNGIAERAGQLIESNRLFVVGVSLVAIGLFFKVSVFPFHTWTPDVYQGSATPLTFFMATGVKAVTFIAILRFVKTGVFGFEASETLVSIIQWLAVLTMMVGNILAVIQTNLKRMLAYSSVSHSGYMLMGLLVVGLSLDDVSGTSALLVYIVGYALTSVVTFGFLSMMERDENSSLTLSDLSGLSQSRPWAAACFALGLLSLGGIPPTLGFFGKLFVFAGAVKIGLYWLTVWAVISSIIAIYYYLRPIVFMFMKESESSPALASGRGVSLGIIALGGALVLALGIWSGGLFNVIQGVLKIGG